MPTNEPFDRLRSLFERAQPLSREERDKLLDRECGNDPELRAQLASLLQSHDDAGAFLPSAAETPAAPASARERTPREIGPYAILEKIGEGGFGVVYLAEQRRPVQRKVALKLLRAGPASAQVLARFDAERQALALMDHPNIAVVHDAGVTEQGDPYFVMEYVAGEAITVYADQRRLDITARLKLFLQVCSAVQHAHMKGVIHRDLKPSNVLVTSSGRDEPLAKVIDFGVAKALGARLTDATLYTQQGIMIGTPEYMSPEQATASPLGVDTRSDVYSLGVILYELLVGALPFDRREAGESGILGLLQLIREKEPRKLTTRLRALGDAAADAAAKRHTDLRSLVHRLRGDLEWITLKALEKDPARRYAGATALAEDIERYLGNHPILARPRSTWYRTQKLVSRHRAASALTAVLTLALVAFAVTVSVLYGRQRTERMKSDRVNAFLVDMLSSVDPGRAKGKEVLVRDILDQATAKVDSSLVSEPAVAATLERTMADTYSALGLYEDAMKPARAAVTASQRAFGAGVETAKALAGLGDLQFNAGQVDSAEVSLRAALKVGESARKRDPELLAFTYNSLANLVGQKGECDEADGLFVKALDAAGRMSGTDSTAYGAILNDRSLNLRICGRLGEAEALAGQVLSLWERKLGPDHPRTVTATGNLATLLQMDGKYEQADSLFKRVLVAQEKILGPEHPNLATNLNNEALVLSALHRFADAESALARSRRIYVKVYGEQSAQVAQNLHNLGSCYERQDRLADAEQTYRRVLTIRQAVLNEDHPNTLTTMNNLARVLAHEGNVREAEPIARRVVQARTARLGAAHPDVRRAQQTLAEVLLQANKLAETDSLLRQCLIQIAADKTAAKGESALLEIQLGECRWKSGDAVAAESLLVRSTPTLISVPSASNGAKRSAAATTADVLASLGKSEEAARFRAIADSLARR